MLSMWTGLSLRTSPDGGTPNCGSKLDVCLSVHRCICVEKKNQLDVPEWFIALMIRSTCFWHFYAHHQELETICIFTAYGV